jgi:hypothetical protein
MGLVSQIELIDLENTSAANCTAILKNTFKRYVGTLLLEVERNTFYSLNDATDLILTKRSPIFFCDVLVTPDNNFVFLFESESHSEYRSIPFSTQFGVINEGSYFVSKRKFMGKDLQCEIFYLPLAFT